MIPSVSVIIPYCHNRHPMINLARCLSSLKAQKQQPFEVIVVDASPDDEREAVRAIVISSGLESLYLPLPFTNYAPAFASTFNEAVRVSKGEMICLLCSNWQLAPDWLKLMSRWLAGLGPGNIVTGNSDRPDWFQGAKEPVEIPASQYYLIDSGFLTMLHRQDWLDWDTEFDPTDMSGQNGAYHAVTEWGHRLICGKRMKLWTWNRPQAKHCPKLPGLPGIQDKVRRSEAILRNKGVR